MTHEQTGFNLDRKPRTRRGAQGLSALSPLDRSAEKNPLPRKMELREVITSESWIEDLLFCQEVMAQPESPQEREDRIFGYFANRYQPSASHAAYWSVRGSCNWLSVNWMELKEIGLIGDRDGLGYFQNSLLLALHNLAFRDPRRERWEDLHDEPFMPVVSEAQAFINAERLEDAGHEQQG